PANVAVPALQGLSYTFEEPSLKQLYLNLLTTASDDRTSELAHPAFADIIKQLTPVEAVLLGRQLGEAHTTAARIRTVRDANAGGFVVLMKHLVPLLDYDTMKPLEEPQMSTWIDNWQRLGLVAVRYDEHEADPDAYDWVATRPEYVRFAADRGQEVVQFDKGLVESTDFGTRFLRAVS
ncbi:MAG TPA: DUF4393 domain-containing protein, partial [Pseudonocardiaceae bacterium]|nr:DUF4393 domain-containing protein [Pseudonocardiaceae bacterium]